MTKTFEAMQRCAHQLDRLNQAFPQLASPLALQGVQRWQSLAGGPPPGRDLRKQETERKAKLEAVARQLVWEVGLEGALDILSSQYGQQLTLLGLVRLIGKREYANILREEGGQLVGNAISFEQIALLWNDMERPAFRGATWSARNVSALLV